MEVVGERLIQRQEGSGSERNTDWCEGISFE
jgi:hypothetical protein